MKKKSMIARHPISLCLIALTTLLLAACDRQQIDPAPVVEPPQQQLNYDGENLSAPLLPAGVYEAAIRFTPQELSGLGGKELQEVILYMQDLPVSATIRVLEGTSNSQPLSIVSSQGIRSELVRNGWSRISLTSPVTINEDEDLWIALRFEHTSDAQTLGCDAGPAEENGDFLFDNADGLWQKLSIRTGGGIDINWNLRAVIE